MASNPAVGSNESIFEQSKLKNLGKEVNELKCMIRQLIELRRQ